MATTNPIVETVTPEAIPSGSLLVVLPASPPAEVETIVSHLSAALPGEELLVATTEGTPFETQPNVHAVTLTTSKPSWTLTASDFAQAYQIAEKHSARGVVMLGPEAGSLPTAGLVSLASTARAEAVDLAVPYYELPARVGLVNSSILYPLSRALFATR